MGKRSTPTNSVPRKKKFGVTHILTLPISQEKVRVRRPSTFSLVAAGGLPADLTALVWRLFGDKDKNLNSVMEQGDELKTYSQLVEKLVPYILVQPTVAAESNCDEVDEEGVMVGSIALMDIPDLDKNHIFMYGVGAVRASEEQEGVVAEDLKTFPAEPTRPDTGSGGEEVRTAAVADGGVELPAPARD
jgi:hypothetical protein